MGSDFRIYDYNKDEDVFDTAKFRSPPSTIYLVKSEFVPGSVCKKTVYVYLQTTMNLIHADRDCNGSVCR